MEISSLLPSPSPSPAPHHHHLDVWVGHHLRRHHQLVPVLLFRKHSPGKLNPDMEKFEISKQYFPILLAAKDRISSDDARLTSSSSNAHQRCLVAHPLVQWQSLEKSSLVVKDCRPPARPAGPWTRQAPTPSPRHAGMPSGKAGQATGSVKEDLKGILLID